MMRGVDTLTSTPQASVNSHSLLGWLTRPTVRGTPNSVLASRAVTRLALSSPVAAITTSHWSRRASSREDISQESASSHSASGTRSGLIETGSLSISSTWWPLVISSWATERPTAPAPAMATRTQCSSGPLVITAKTSAASSSRITRWSRSPSWITDSRVGSMPSPSRSIQAIRLLDCTWKS